MASNKVNRLINEIRKLNEKRYIPKRREFTKAEQEIYDILFESLTPEDQEELLKTLDETPDYNLAQ